MLNKFIGLKKRWLKVVKVLSELGGEASFDQIKKNSALPPSTVSYILQVLVRKNLVKLSAKGRYRLAFYTPLIFLNENNAKNSTAYFGLLGLKMNREEPEYKVATRQLKKNGYNIKKKVIATTLRAMQSWGEEVIDDVEWFILKENSLFDPKIAESTLKEKILNLAKNNPLIVDVTSGPRTAALALFKISSEYSIPTIYVREDKAQLIWIKHPREILQAI